MSIYLSRFFPRSNSSFSLYSGNALKSSVLRLREEMFLVDAGLGSPRIAMQHELTGGAPIKQGARRFENQVGFLGNQVGGESLIQKRRSLEGFFIDLVAGESKRKVTAAAIFNDLVGGSKDVFKGDPLLLLPRKFRENRARMELFNLWRKKKDVKGFLIKKDRRGYLVAIAGFIAHLPMPPVHKGTRRKRGIKVWSDRFTIKSIHYNPKGKRTNMILSKKTSMKKENERRKSSAFQMTEPRVYLKTLSP